jgi:hypothetical protein
MEVNIVDGTRITKVKRTLETIRRMNKKGVILPTVAKILCKWDVAADIRTSYYRISK